MRARPSRLLPLLLLFVACLSGCRTLQPGPITSPGSYPDRTGPDEVFHTFLYAWKTGDVDVLQQCLGGGLRNTLRKQLETRGRKKTAAFYRDDQLELVAIDWIERGDLMARVRVTLAGAKAKRLEVIFGCVERRPEDWTVSGKKIIPRQ